MKKAWIYCFQLLLIAIACSPQKNTWTSRAYNDVTAHYNAYYYALEEVSKIEAAIRSNWTDDYNSILMIFPSFDSTLANTYEAETEEAIKMASLAIQNHGNSRWVDDSYILVGKARLYSLDWGNAIQTFKYVNNIGKDKDAKHQAIINLIRTFTEHEEFNNALAAIDFLKKENLSKQNKKRLYLEMAYYYQIRKDYNNMIVNLSNASPLLEKKDRRGRIYFIIGQVYQELGFESEAYNFYRKCLATNPEYEVDFYARLYMAQVAEISRSKSLSTARKSFRKLLKDSKNKDFKDKIYYELGIFELKQKNLNEAIESFNLSLRAGNNQRVKGEAYLRLGELYYDTLKQFELSQSYYDSAIRSLPTTYENYLGIKDRSEILNEFVLNLKTIEWQDSLLSLASLDTAALRKKIVASIDEKKRLEAAAQGKKKKNNRIVINSASSTLFSASAVTSDWYFGNPSAVAMGETEFKRLWGDRPLEDDWRRSQKLSAPSLQTDNTIASTDNGNAPEEKVEVDPVEEAFASLDKEIPRTEEAREISLKKIEDAYYALGDIYYFKLLEKGNALSSFETLLERFPNTEHEPDVLYKLYLIQKDTNPIEAQRYASLLKNKYPDSSYAKILINPNYLAESGIAIEKQQELYQKAYHDFENNRFKEANGFLEQGFELGKTPFTPNLELLKILLIGKTQPHELYRSSLNQFIETYEENELAPYAKNLLAASEKLQQQEKKPSIQYIKEFNTTHYFMIVYDKKERIGDVASRVLARFNQNAFPLLKLKTSNLVLDEDFTLTMVSEFTDLEQARNYYQTFGEKQPTLNEFANHKFFTFVITKDNFDIFYRTKALNEYIRFFEQNYNSKNQ